MILRLLELLFYFSRIICEIIYIKLIILYLCKCYNTKDEANQNCNRGNSNYTVFIFIKNVTVKISTPGVLGENGENCATESFKEQLNL